jgi:hypothetical protein
MTDKIISIEEQPGPFQLVLKHILRMVPDRDKNDVQLQRLLAFRLRLDGEAALREYLTTRIRQASQCGYTGSLYDFLKDDLKEKACRPPSDAPASEGMA